jgi:hypothetical protein
MENGNVLIRANRVAVKSNGENFVADFYRTHKAVGSIHSEETEWVAPEDVVNKTAARESFRLWAIANCENYGIFWKPEDLRSPNNIRNPKYDSDEALIKDAMSMAIDEMRTLVEKCKYGIEWGGITHEDIVPLTHTGTGRDLSTLGIEDGKYLKSGNWAWADLKFVVTFKYKGEECYITVTMKLVSGQLKKTGMGILEFNDKVKAELIAAGMATEEELNPPKSTKKNTHNNKDNQEVDENDYTDVSEDGDMDTDDSTDDAEAEDCVVEESTMDADNQPMRSRKAKKSKRR